RAAAGDLAETLARLEACGAEPGLVALAKRCLAPNPAERPSDALEKKGDLDGALAAFKEAVRLNPNDATAHNNLGFALKRKGDPGGAFVAYRKAARLDPKYTTPLSNLAGLGRELGKK